MDDKQKVTAKGKESQAAGRDIVENHYHIGPNLSEIQSLIELTYNEQVKKLVSEYMHKNMQTFAKNLLNTIDAKSLSEKISSSPDLAFVIDKTIKIVGEKGDNLDLDVLLKLIEDRINSNDNSFLNIVIEQSIEKVDKLTSKQIALLTHIHVIQNISFKVTTPQELDDIFKNLMPLVEDSFDISEANKKYLASLGLIEINILKGNNTKDKFYNTYKYFSEKLNRDEFINKYMELNFNEPEFLENNNDNFENLKKFYMNYEINELYQLHLTTVGEMIALSNLKKIYPDLNVEIWIK